MYIEEAVGLEEKDWRECGSGKENKTEHIWIADRTRLGPRALLSI